VSGRKAQVRMTALQRYYWLLLHFARVFGVLARIWAVVIGFPVLTDLLGLSHWGYPRSAILFCAGFFLFGHLVSRFARSGLVQLRSIAGSSR
jgi:hypothetical protein